MGQIVLRRTGLDSLLPYSDNTLIASHYLIMKLLAVVAVLLHLSGACPFSYQFRLDGLTHSLCLHAYIVVLAGPVINKRQDGGGETTVRY
jgi:hypothetical protein